MGSRRVRLWSVTRRARRFRRGGTPRNTRGQRRRKRVPYRYTARTGPQQAAAELGSRVGRPSTGVQRVPGEGKSEPCYGPAVHRGPIRLGRPHRLAGGEQGHRRVRRHPVWGAQREGAVRRAVEECCVVLNQRPPGADYSRRALFSKKPRDLAVPTTIHRSATGRPAPEWRRPAIPRSPRSMSASGDPGRARGCTRPAHLSQGERSVHRDLGLCAQAWFDMVIHLLCPVDSGARGVPATARTYSCPGQSGGSEPETAEFPALTPGSAKTVSERWEPRGQFEGAISTGRLSHAVCSVTRRAGRAHPRGNTFSPSSSHPRADHQNGSAPRQSLVPVPRNHLAL